ncbi:MAG TPA: hypothetical protein PK447_00375 [Ignavibacteria bacterium]|nr:hypothetical protein [Ignavibacteria bacterium]
MKNLIIAVLFLMAASMSFAQNATNRWGNDNVQTISGTVTDNARPTVMMKTSDGTVYRIHLGPVWYWKDNGYTLNTGEVTIKGNVKTQNNNLQIYPFTIQQGGTTITLADDNGVPKWSPRGKGNNNGNGNGNGYNRGNCPYRK